MTCESMFLFVFFFFSSRRRHTRLVSDWSSDVCSSDLMFSFVDFLKNQQMKTSLLSFLLIAIQFNVSAQKNLSGRITDKNDNHALENIEIGRASCRERV